MRNLIAYLPIIVLLALIGCDAEDQRVRFDTWVANHPEFKVVDGRCHPWVAGNRCTAFIHTPMGLQEVHLLCPVGGCSIVGVRGK